MQLGAGFAGGTNKSDGETRFIRHRHERRFAITRVALKANLFSIDRFVSLEIIQCAARAPCPSSQRAPIIDLARLPSVAEANDATVQTRAVVGLNAIGNQAGVTPTSCQNLLLPGWSTWYGSTRWWRRRAKSRRKDKAEFHDHRNWTGCICGRGQGQLNVDGDLWNGRIINMAHQLLGDHRNVTILLIDSAGNFPLHLGCGSWNPTINLAVEVLHDLRTPLVPPCLSACHFLTVLQEKRVGQFRIWISLRLIVVRCIGR